MCTGTEPSGSERNQFNNIIIVMEKNKKRTHHYTLSSGSSFWQRGIPPTEVEEKNATQFMFVFGDECFDQCKEQVTS